MNGRLSIGFGVTALVFVHTAAAQTLNIVAVPATATIFRVKVQDQSLVPLGTGTAKFKLEKNDPNTIVVRQDGFRDGTRSFPKDDNYKDKEYTIFLSKRVVKFSALPFDANILVNGEVRGRNQIELEVQDGQATTVEVKKTGYATLSRVYRWEKGGEYPPSSDRVELVDRKVSISAGPAGVELFNDDKKIGDADGELIVKRGTCANLRAQKNGWIPVERSYCNKEGMAEPPIADRVALAGRSVAISAPEGAKIFVNQKQAGVGTFAVKINDGSCAKIRVEQVGRLPFAREYCVQDNAPSPPFEESVTLEPDDSFAASSASDQANVQIGVEVGAGKLEDWAWKMLTSVVTEKFDVLESTDAQSGYLRTAWEIKTYGRNNDVVIRTRVFLRRANDVPLRYTVKIESQRNKYAGGSIKDDENFEPWDRILKKYDEIISQMQSRVK